MSEISEAIMIIAGILLALFIMAWFTILPTLGLFYICGWLA